MRSRRKMSNKTERTRRQDDQEKEKEKLDHFETKTERKIQVSPITTQTVHTQDQTLQTATLHALDEVKVK